MRHFVLCTAIVCALARVAAADDGAGSSSAAPTPTLSKGWAAASVAGVYGAFGTWAYFAWFHGAHTSPFWVDDSWADENPFGLHTYAGGADKWGHLWANYVLTRGTTELLVAGGYRRLPASLVAAGLAEAAFTASEIKDGFIWGFEVGDIAGNVAGAALAVLLENSPALDRLFDIRMQYFPSADFGTLLKNKLLSRGDGLDVAQDYTGQSFMVALHLGALPHALDSPWSRWMEYVDLVGGFETRYYSPPPMPREFAPYQSFYAGLTINMQAVLTSLLPESRGRTIGRGIFEVFQIPGTTVRFAEARRVWDSPPAQPPPE